MKPYTIVIALNLAMGAVAYLFSYHVITPDVGIFAFCLSFIAGFNLVMSVFFFLDKKKAVGIPFLIAGILIAGVAAYMWYFYLTWMAEVAAAHEAARGK